MNNNFINITHIYIPRYIYLDQIYDFDDIFINIAGIKTDETRKRKRIEENEEKDLDIR